MNVKGLMLGNVKSFKYLGAVVSDDGSKPEILSKTEHATTALTQLKLIVKDNNISLGFRGEADELSCHFHIFCVPVNHGP